jgi:hypothetical protein
MFMMAALTSLSQNGNISIISVSAFVGFFFFFHVEMFLVFCTTSDFCLYLGHFGHVLRFWFYLNVLVASATSRQKGHLSAASWGGSPALFHPHQHCWWETMGGSGGCVLHQPHLVGLGLSCHLCME